MARAFRQAAKASASLVLGRSLTTTLGITRYIIGHSLKVQADMSYNTRSRSIDPNYNRWEIRFQLELGL